LLKFSISQLILYLNLITLHSNFKE